MKENVFVYNTQTWILTAMNLWMDCLVAYRIVWKTRHQPTLITPPNCVPAKMCVCLTK